MSHHPFPGRDRNRFGTGIRASPVHAPAASDDAGEDIAEPMTRTLVRNGHVLTMDPALGDLPIGDVLIEDGVIAAVAPSIPVAEAEAEAIGRDRAPRAAGPVDTHRHTWQSLVRGICGDWTLGDYYFGIRLASPRPTRRRRPARQPLGALDALNSGVTTLLDFSHCNNTPDHADGAVLGLQDAGIRAAFCYGFFESSPEATQFGEHSARLADYHRIADTYFSSDGLLTLGVSLSELFGLPWDRTVAELAAARERRALIVNHTGCVWGSVLTGGSTELDALGLLGPDMAASSTPDVSRPSPEPGKKLDPKNRGEQ